MARDTSKGFRSVPDGFQRHAFFLAPDEYGVIDGDTIYVDTLVENGGHLRFKIRFSSTNAPEMPVKRMTDDFLMEMGIDPHASNPGSRAATIMHGAMAGRPVFVVPAVQQDGSSLDRYGRLLADIYISGPDPTPEEERPDTKGFDLDGYVSASRLIFEAGYAELMPGKTLPSPTNPRLEQLRFYLENDEDQLAWEPD